MKKQIPLLMSSMMVQAILAGRKTVTRRIAKHMELPEETYPKMVVFDAGYWMVPYWNANNLPALPSKSHRCPYGKPGDILYVRENWFPAAINGNKILIGVDPKDSTQSWEIVTDDPAPYWKKMNRGCMIPSIHMPKEASRIWLEVTDIRVERLQDIGEQDVCREGAGQEVRQMWLFGLNKEERDKVYRRSFEKLWTEINDAESWAANPWVWVVSFKVLSTTGKPAELEKEEAV